MPREHHTTIRTHLKRAVSCCNVATKASELTSVQLPPTELMTATPPFLTKSADWSKHCHSYHEWPMGFRRAPVNPSSTSTQRVSWRVGYL